jgi:chromosomal replication initiator protein
MERIRLSLSFSRFLPTPENRSALAAAQQVADSLGGNSGHHRPNPLYLHGPTGTGKTHLVSTLVAEVTRQNRALIATTVQANDLAALLSLRDSVASNTLDAIRDSDLVVVEDLQHLCGPGKGASPGVIEGLVQLFDYLYLRQSQLVFTATVGPGQLPQLPDRLTSRLGCGLVVGLEPLRAESRLSLLKDKAQRRQLAVSLEVLAWLADRLRGGIRQLEGAVVRLETLARLNQRPLELATVARQFEDEVEAGQPTVQRIAARVGSYFQVELRRLQSRRRYQNLVLPRQVSMYLARRLTDLSLEQIGRYFGGRDHSTVLHACRKIELLLARNSVLTGVIRQLHADLA